MKKPKNYISERAGIDTVKRFFANTPDSDVVSLDVLFQLPDRVGVEEQTNRNWLANKMTQLRYHGLIQPDYRYENSRKKLNGIKLTIKGKRALGRIEGEEYTPSNERASLFDNSASNQTVSAGDVAKAVQAFRDTHPEFEVLFQIKLKEVQPTK